MLKLEEIAKSYEMSTDALNGLPFSNGDYRISYNPSLRIYSDFAGNHPTSLGDGIVVDAGCSYGNVTYELCHIYPEHKIIGCDVEVDRFPDPAGIPLAIADRLTFAKGDIFHLDRLFEPSSVACIYAMNNLTYLVSQQWSTVSDPLTALLVAARFHRILMPDGFVCTSGGGDGVSNCASAVLRKNAEGFYLIYCNQEFPSAAGLSSLCRAFDIPVRYSGT